VRIVEYCNIAGAIVAGRLLCSDAMPTLAEVEDALEDRRVAG
jgi:5-dehydro-2-deoxygluconokinase